MVRKDASPEQRLAALEQIVKDQTQWSIRFSREQADAIVIRSSGTYRLAGERRVSGDERVHLYAGDRNAQRGTAESACGSVAELLHHLANAIGMPILDTTRSSDIELCWETHASSRLRDQREVPRLYNAQLASLLSHLTRQTGLIFTIELGTVSRWQITPQRGPTAARSN